QLLTLPGVKPAELKTVHSHVMALGQCRKAIRALNLKAVVAADTAGAARELRESGDRTAAAIASKLAAEIYGLKVAQADIEDAEHNTTRFVVLAAKPVRVKKDDGPVVTSLVFRVRNLPAALYKALGGVATNGVNMTKLESYQLEGSFNATMFYADIEGHPDERPVNPPIEGLAFFSRRAAVQARHGGTAFLLERGDSARHLPGESLPRRAQSLAGLTTRSDSTLAWRCTVGNIRSRRMGALCTCE